MPRANSLPESPRDMRYLQDFTRKTKLHSSSFDYVRKTSGFIEFRFAKEREPSSWLGSRYKGSLRGRFLSRLVHHHSHLHTQSPLSVYTLRVLGYLQSPNIQHHIRHQMVAPVALLLLLLGVFTLAAPLSELQSNVTISERQLHNTNTFEDVVCECERAPTFT